MISFKTTAGYVEVKRAAEDRDLWSEGSQRPTVIQQQKTRRRRRRRNVEDKADYLSVFNTR